MRSSKILLLVSSLLTLAVLALAVVQENVWKDWRRLQKKYRAALPAETAADFSLQLRQIVVPSLKAADRCVSCHVGMAPGEQGIEGHPLYGKQRTRTKTVVAHDEANAAKVGDVVRIMETRPLSKTKRWRVVEIVRRAE